uniref:hypothetical protein n=1 Tax=Candidatus Thiodubiliella endoseptemdiera TaxID=2738886 RepID=UPI0034E01299
MQRSLNIKNVWRLAEVSTISSYIMRSMIAWLKSRLPMVAYAKFTIWCMRALKKLTFLINLAPRK